MESEARDQDSAKIGTRPQEITTDSPPRSPFSEGEEERWEPYHVEPQA